jgi:hypothetical protein
MGGWEADFENDDAGKYESALRDVIAIFRSLSKTPIKFKAIIPTKLSLEIDGISNLIIGHMFNIHPDLLPKGYKTEGDSEAGRRLGYILTGIGHTINDSGWTTKLDGQTIILEEPEGEEKDLFNITLSKKGKVEKVETNIKVDKKGNLKSSKVSLGSYIKSEYIPTLEKALPTGRKGIKLLMIAQSNMEGFYPKSLSYKSNNPGNIGNTDNGGRAKPFASLEAGILAQYNFTVNVATNKGKNYKLGARKKAPSIYDKDSKQTYPGIDFVYNGSLNQYLQIYSTGARKYDTYLKLVIGVFAQNGITITGDTTLQEIYDIT